MICLRLDLVKTYRGVGALSDWRFLRLDEAEKRIGEVWARRLRTGSSGHGSLCEFWDFGVIDMRLRGAGS